MPGLSLLANTELSGLRAPHPDRRDRPGVELRDRRDRRGAHGDQVILPADIQDSLTELIARIRQRRVVFDRWGFDRITSTARGVTALFQGGPGTGKTLVASAIASESNFGSSLDTAFKRRLSLRLTFPFPDDDQRERLWRAHVPAETPVAGDFDFAALARRYRLSGGYTRNCALRAAFIAVEEGSALTAEHLARAIKAELREIGKLADSGVLE